MDKIKIMINGLPGNMAIKLAGYVLQNEQFELILYSLTGPDITDDKIELKSQKIELIKPEERDKKILEIKQKEGFFISVDYTHPTAVLDNAIFYCKNNLDFVMGTTGVNTQTIEKTVRNSNICAIIAPNMAKQIVGFQAMMEFLANNFPNLFKGYTLEIQESHQMGKADTSGTAKAMVKYFNKLGIDFREEEIQKERDPKRQKEILNVPEEHIKGHAWHTYNLISGDKTVNFKFCHNINGRDVYALGTLDAVLYLNNKINSKETAEKGEVYSMIDVLRG